LLEQALDFGAVLVRHGGNVEAIDLDSDFDRLIFLLGHVSGCLPGKYSCLCRDGMVLVAFSKDYATAGLHRGITSSERFPHWRGLGRDGLADRAGGEHRADAFNAADWLMQMLIIVLIAYPCGCIADSAVARSLVPLLA